MSTVRDRHPHACRHHVNRQRVGMKAAAAGRANTLLGTTSSVVVPDGSGPAAGAAGHVRGGVRDAAQAPDTRGHAAASDATAGCGPTGTGRRVGGRWWDAANAGRRGRAGRSGGRGAGRGRRSSPGG
jgi:hypothetical protein